MKPVFAAALVMLAGATSAQAACPRQNPADVADAVRAMYAGFKSSDAAALRTRLTPEFYAFETGVRMDGAALPDLLARNMQAGRRYEWSVTEPVVHMRCDLATIAYRNVGAVGDASGMRPQTWLESATLRYEKGVWRVMFLNSGRVPPPPPTGGAPN
jgi:hypothetical protein